MADNQSTSRNSRALILLSAVIAFGLAGCAGRQLVPAPPETTTVTFKQSLVDSSTRKTLAEVEVPFLYER